MTGAQHPDLTEAQRQKLTARLGKRHGGRDTGQVLPATGAALSKADPAERLEALVAALGQERVIVAVQVEDPDHNVPRPDSEIDFEYISVDGVGPTLVVFTSVQDLAAHDPKARPMPLEMRSVALTALAAAGGHVLVNPNREDPVLLPRPAVNALAHGDTWLPAWRDAELRDELRQRTGAAFDKPVMDVSLEYAGGADVRVNVLANPALEPTAVRAALDRAFEAIQTSPRLGVAAERVVLTPVWATPA